MTRRCIAPLDDGDALCGAPATTTRSVEDLDCALCAAHAAEIDHDRQEETTMATTDTTTTGEDIIEAARTAVDRKRIGRAMGRIAKRHGVSEWVSGESSHGWWAWGTTRDGDTLRIRVTNRVIVASIDGRKVSVEGLDDCAPPKC